MEHFADIESRYYESPEWTEPEVKHDASCEMLDDADQDTCACLERAEEDAENEAADRAFERMRDL